MEPHVNIGATIARERCAAGVTQEALAKHLGVTKAAVSKWELGLSLPDVSLLPRIAAYFSLSLDELFDWRARLSEEEVAAIFARVCAEGREDVATAREHLRSVVSEHFSDWNLLLVMSSLLTTWSAMAESDGEAVGLRDEAAELLQVRRLAAAMLVLSTLLQEIGASDDAAFVLAASSAACAVGDALSIEAVNPLFSVTLEGEAAAALLRAGERDEALAALARAVDAAERLSSDEAASASSPLLSRAVARLDPEQHGAAWAEHKRAQLAEARAAARAALVERLADPAWEGLADDPVLAQLRARVAAWQ